MELLNVEPLSRYWGKARRAEDAPGPEWHPFALHSLDVTAVAFAWLERSSTLRRLFGIASADPEDSGLAWVLFFVALHDLGKLDVRFQFKAVEIARQIGWPANGVRGRASEGFDHGRAGLGWFVDEYGRLSDRDVIVQSLADWMEQVTSHHGTLTVRFASPGDRGGGRPDLLEQDRLAREQWIRLLEELFLVPAGLTLNDEPPVVSPALAGFCSICDWIGSDTEFFPYTDGVGIELRGYIELRRGRQFAVRALEASGMLGAPARNGGMAAVFPQRTPRGVQKCIEEVPMAPGLVIVEGPTGSGKTEAALALASRYLAAGIAESIIFALPTQATANQMFDRVVNAVERLFPDARPTVVLAHGKARFNETFQGLKRATNRENYQREEDAWAQCRKWTASSRKRVFLGQLGVCTVDQLLMSVLPIRHNFVRGFGALRSVLIVDEVHAYDSYMNTLLDKVLDAQRESGGVAVLLSATLPSVRREALVHRWNRQKPAEDRDRQQVDVPYPLVSVASEAGFGALRPDDEPVERCVSFNTVVSEEALPPDALIDKIVDASARGARVAIVCNIVAHAQKIARALRADPRVTVPVDLFHSRFRFEDRLRIEMDVLRNYGTSAPAGAGRILVATQVVEQSLDIDFDWLVTQICPIELLIQRIGRLQRHDLARRPLGSELRCTVLVPDTEDFRPHCYVYRNPRTLWRTVRMIADGSTLVFPGAYRASIERVFDPEPWDDEPASVVEAFESYEADCYAQVCKARTVSGAGIAPFADTDGNAAALTRDSESSLTVVPIVEGAASQTLLDGTRLDQLDDWERDRRIDLGSIRVPGTWRPVLPSMEDHVIFLPMTADGTGGWTANRGEVHLVYSTGYGLERSDR